jgi:hypothetical protein
MLNTCWWIMARYYYRKIQPAVSSPADPAVCNEDVSFVSFSDVSLSFKDFKLPPVCGGGVDD